MLEQVVIIVKRNFIFVTVRGQRVKLQVGTFLYFKTNMLNVSLAFLPCDLIKA